MIYIFCGNDSKKINLNISKISNKKEVILLTSSSTSKEILINYASSTSLFGDVPVIIIDNYNGYLFDLEGYDEIKNNIEISYDNILDKLSSKTDKTILNIISKIEQVIKIDINDYNNLQLNCFNTYHQYSQIESTLDIKKLFNL